MARSTLEDDIHCDLRNNILRLCIFVKAIADLNQLNFFVSKSALPKSIDQLSYCCWTVCDYTTTYGIKGLGCNSSFIMCLVTCRSQGAFTSFQLLERLDMKVTYIYFKTICQILRVKIIYELLQPMMETRA